MSELNLKRLGREWGRHARGKNMDVYSAPWFTAPWYITGTQCIGALAPWYITGTQQN